MKETPRRTKQCTENYRSLGRKKSGIARDAASGHPFRWFGGVFRVSAAGGLSRSREQISAVSFYFTQRHRSGGDLHRSFALGGGWSTAVCTHEFTACGCGLAGFAGDLTLSW